MASGKFRLRNLAFAAAALVALQAALSLSLRLRPVHRVLLARLERAIGRPVEVGRFDLSLWSVPRLQALYVTVEDDPQFGAEFLLRADRLEAAPDWRALLRGHLAFSRFWLERPSLNLVRAPSGRWNYQDWEPARGAPAGAPGGHAPYTARVAQLTIREGRINFKRGPEKLPFALTAVNGTLSALPGGQWRLSLRAQPFRAGVTLQDAGAFRLDGSLPAPGISSAAAGPLELAAHWESASLPDALRLIFGRDFGVRGRLESSLTLRSATPPAISASAVPAEAPSAPSRASAASSSPPAWAFSAVMRLTDVHRWDLPLAPGLPALNLSLEGTGSASRRRWEVSNLLLEAPRSNLRGRALFDRDASPAASLRVVTASIRLDDLLAWYRAFHSGVDPAITVEGFLGADVELEAWPPAVLRAALVTTGAKLTLPAQRGSLLLRRTVLEADRAGARLADAALAFAEDDPGVHLSAKLAWAPGFPFSARISGGTDHLAVLSAAVAALGLGPAAKPLAATGTAGLRLASSGTLRPWSAATLGSLAFENASISGGALRGEITGKARLDFLPGQRKFQFAAVKAFGGHWSGSMSAPTLAGPWHFTLAVDRVNPALLVRGFSSQPPEDSSLLSRILPAQAAATEAREEPRWPAWLRGEGTISAGALAVGRLELQQLKGRLSVAERGIALDAAEASLAGGRVRGRASAVFGEAPRYDLHAEFDAINLAALTALAVSTRQCCTGIGSGSLELNASGWNRDALLASLKGAGRAQVRGAALLTLDLPASLAAESAVPGHTPLRDVSADFSFANSHLWLDRLTAEFPAGSADVLGNADYHGQLEIGVTPAGKETKNGRRPSALRLTGTLAVLQASPAQKRAP